jgi:hypothetical protein
MSQQWPTYISKDIDRIIFMTASVTGFFFVVTWILYGANKLIGEETDWTPVGYDTIESIRMKVQSVYEAIEPENSEPEDEEESGTEAKMD